MDLSLPLRSLIPSLDADVLAVLAGTESSLGATRIASIAARGSRQGITNVLERLSEHGLVDAHATNKGHVYSLNRDHVLVHALIDALEARSRVIAAIQEQVGRLRPEPLHASLFGSFARGGGNPGSDIDLLVVAPPGLDVHDPSWRSQLDSLESSLLRMTGNRVESLVMSADAFRGAVHDEEPLIASLGKDNHRLAGLQFGELVGEGAAR